MGLAPASPVMYKYSQCGVGLEYASSFLFNSIFLLCSKITPCIWAFVQCFYSYANVLLLPALHHSHMLGVSFSPLGTRKKELACK